MLEGFQRTTLAAAVAEVPAGAWGVAVSGGADSVALLRLLALRDDVRLVVVHVDHELRGEASRGDAEFVGALAGSLLLPMHLARRSTHPVGREIDRAAPAALRRLRLAVYADAVRQHNLAGMLLGHHADDLAETLMLRLLRGSAESGTLGLRPLQRVQEVRRLTLRRPLLGVRRHRLRQWLERLHQPWREDASNEQPVSRRNRLRLAMADRPGAIHAALDLCKQIEAAEMFLESATPADAEVHDPLPWPIRRRVARRWLIEAGVPQSEAGPRAVEMLLSMLDATGPRVVQFAGGVRVRRMKGRLVRES